MNTTEALSDSTGLPILGIDPGLDTTGYGVLELRDGRLVIREAGVIRTTPDESLGSRLEQIFDGVRELISSFHPAVMAVEQLHSTYEHPQTAILMGHARGVICLAAAQEVVPIASYRPTQVKKSLTGSGRAGKDQMQRAIQCEFGLSEPPNPPDVADALAVALCHFYTTRHAESYEQRIASPPKS
ncbi:MAG: crossover junction endodeoxyribonuclease RuvC [Planctomycetes bacterium]|nr:crossover junction endodeoxyribonuclease RuvC [Planctomycetota bacterium]